MPEGDTIHNAARRLGAALVGSEIRSIETPQERHGKDHWPERLAGRAVRAVDAHGKHLFLRFDGGLTVHSHLRMSGAWGVYARGERWRRPPWRAWLVLRTDEHDVVQFDGPVLELMTDDRSRFDQRLAALGPDPLHDDFDEARYVCRLREDDPTRGIGEALLDQRTIAGIGNIWKNEGCFLAGVSPWRRVGDVSGEEALELVRGIRPLMRASAERGGRITTFEGEAKRNEWRTWVHERAGMPCRRCTTAIRARGQGDDNRTAYWCPQCQR
jgi:endonuclease-8